MTQLEFPSPTVHRGDGPPSREWNIAGTIGEGIRLPVGTPELPTGPGDF